MPQPLIAVGHHGTPAIPAPAPDDVHGVHRERVGGAHHRTDVGVVAEVFDRDVQRVPAAIDIGDDRLPGPVPVGVDDVSSVTVPQQDWVIPWVVGEVARPRPDAAGRWCPPFGGPGFRFLGAGHRMVHTPAWVPTIATVA